jgi:cell division septum initiation protein DivIVA
MTNKPEEGPHVPYTVALLEAQAQEIAAFQDTVVKSISFWTHIHQKQERRIAELEAALKPFAYYAEQIPDDVSDTASASGTVGDLRAARAALKGEK